MYFECRNCSGSVPSFTPRTDFSPASPAAEQIVRSSCEAPDDERIAGPWTRHSERPAFRHRNKAESLRSQTPQRSPEIAQRSRRAPRPTKSAPRCPVWTLPLWRANSAAGPLGPILRMGYITRSGEYTRSRYFATFAHKNPRVTGCSGSPESRSPPILHRNQHTTSIRAIMRTRRFDNLLHDRSIIRAFVRKVVSNAVAKEEEGGATAAHSEVDFRRGATRFPLCLRGFVVSDFRRCSYFNSSTSFSFALLISSIFLISPSVSF